LTAIPIRTTIQRRREAKSVEATQKAIDALKPNSGTYSVEGIDGLYVRCRRKAKSFYIQRRVGGKLIKVSLGPLKMAVAKERAKRAWLTMKGLPAGPVATFAQAYNAYMELKPNLKERSAENYQYDFEHCLTDLHAWSLVDLASDAGRREVQRLQARLRKQRGEASSNRAMRLISAVYNRARRTDSTLPLEPPTKAIDLYRIEPRNWALSDEELKAWAANVAKLTPLKRMFWIMALLTGARQGSIRTIERDHVNLDLKVAKFFNTKREPYAVPLSDLLCEHLTRYLEEEGKSESRWLFPSPIKYGEPLGQVKQRGMRGPHCLRHCYKTRGVGVVSTEVSRILLGQGADPENRVNFDYVTLSLTVQPLRATVNWYADMYAKLLPNLLLLK
jgi:integrase